MKPNLKDIIGDDSLYNELQEFLSNHPSLSEGDVARGGIREWLKQAQIEGKFAEDFSYYSTLTTAELQENKTWREIAAESFAINSEAREQMNNPGGNKNG